MGIFDKEFKRKSRKRKGSYEKKKSYAPRSKNLTIGKNDKRDPLPSYWSLR